jgi:hypothetical protein
MQLVELKRVMGFEVLTAASIKVGFFRDLTPCQWRENPDFQRSFHAND